MPIAMETRAIAFKYAEGNRWYPILPAIEFEQGGRKIPITAKDIESMASLFKSGDLGPSLPVTIAHPELSSAPAEGWITDVEVRDLEGVPTLFAAIDPLEDLDNGIKKKKWGYLSPVFSMNWVDQGGKERGPAMLAVGVTNSPHWRTQPELWNAFTARIAQAGTWDDDGQGLVYTKEQTRKIDAGVYLQSLTLRFTRERFGTEHRAQKWIDRRLHKLLAASNPEVTEMTEQEIKELQDKVTSMTAENAKLVEENKKAQEQLASESKKVVEFTAKLSADKATVESLAATVKDLTEAAKKKEISEKVTKAQDEGRITGDQVQQFTALATKDMASFDAIVATLPAKKLPTSNVGGSDTADLVQLSAPERAHKFAAKYCDEHKNVDFGHVYAVAKSQLSDGKKDTEIIIM